MRTGLNCSCPSRLSIIFECKFIQRLHQNTDVDIFFELGIDVKFIGQPQKKGKEKKKISLQVILDADPLFKRHLNASVQGLSESDKAKQMVQNQCQAQRGTVWLFKWLSTVLSLSVLQAWTWVALHFEDFKQKSECHTDCKETWTPHRRALENKYRPGEEG